MLNYSLKNEAIKIHGIEVEKYNVAYNAMIENCKKLFIKRESAVGTIKDIEWLINSIANTPKEFETKIGEIQKERDNFKETQVYVDKAKMESIKSGVGVISGVAGGIAFAGLAPSAAMGIATTFGTASTGTAISALSGAVAQKAALAWLGGGALTAGGGGVAAGNALLALAGPIGWGISAVSTGVSLFALSKKNKDIANEAVEGAKSIAKMRSAVKENNEKVITLYEETDLFLTNLREDSLRLQKYADSDYTKLDNDIQMQLGALVNNTLAMSKFINTTVCEKEE